MTLPPCTAAQVKLLGLHVEDCGGDGLMVMRLESSAQCGWHSEVAIIGPSRVISTPPKAPIILCMEKHGCNILWGVYMTRPGPWLRSEAWPLCPEWSKDIEVRRRVISDCHFRKTATEYDRKTGMKWLCCTEK
jgi:hypothetical protein